MKIVLLLLSSAILAVLCYAAFRENVTVFYDYIEKIEKPFDEDKFMRNLKKEAKEINLYSKNKEDKKALKKLLKKHDIYTNVYMYDDSEEIYLGGDFGKVLDESIGFNPLYSLQNDFEQYSFNKVFSESVKFKDGEGIVYVGSMHSLKYVKYYFYFALFVSLMIFFLPTFIFIKRKVKYINILKQEVLNMSQGDLSHSMTVISHDELAILSKEMDSLRRTLAQNIENEERIKEAHHELITSLSHDLRTPLTTLRGYLDILSLHCYKNEQQMDHYLKGCIEKTEQIKDLSNKTFEYSLVYEQDFSIQLEKISSQELLNYFQDNLEYLELEGFQLQKEINFHEKELLLDFSMMKRLINNLCSNIMKYAKKDKEVFVEFSMKQDQLKIVFQNEKKQDLQHVESNKIGLKSVQRIVEMHHGEIFIQDQDLYTVIIVLPTT